MITTHLETTDTGFVIEEMVYNDMGDILLLFSYCPKRKDLMKLDLEWMKEFREEQFEELQQKAKTLARKHLEAV